MKLNWKKSEAVEGRYEANLTAKLLSISNQTFKNVNETEYRIAVIEVEGKSINAIMYEKNFQYGVENGKSYACRASFDSTTGSKDVLITVSHLVAGERVTIDDLGFELPVDEMAEIKAAEKEFAKVQ
jgi:hypothetical protein